MKIDIHTHILPETWPDLRERYGYGGWVRMEHHKPCCARMMIDDRFFREVEENCWSPEVRIHECDRHGVHVQVLSTVPVMFSYWAQPEHAHDLSRTLNDHIASVVERHPKRFVGLCTLPMQAPELAVKELERCVKTLGMPGVEIGSHINEWNLDDESLFPFYEAAQDLGAAIFVHPWDMMGKEKMPRYWLPWLVGMPAETSLAICSVLFGGVLDRFPNLRFCFSHGGGSFPFTLGRIEHGFHVRPDLVQVRTTTEPRALVPKLYFDSLVHDPAALRYMLDLFTPERVMLGSDYPFPLGEHHPGGLIESMADLDAASREQLLAGTALEFLGLRQEAFA
ncbi:MAG TPA: amidohydrolase family protein [Candidatus Kapabacteria bacterium]|nr:amidohydrolase family protein [Candidatus Kapabacteria bacterium]